ncbi:MAG: putative 4-mercaptohistidine N1-methyltransferase [Limisphaerales bacterium]
MAENYYDSDRALSEYLLFHYGGQDDRIPGSLAHALQFPVRCVSECLDAGRLPPQARALDLGCAVGRGSFELARHCAQVLGIDFSASFVSVATHLRDNGSFSFNYVEEGELTRPHRAVVPPDIDRKRVNFEQGDAVRLRSGLGQFDVVLLANLIDRVDNPTACLEQMPELVVPGGPLVITSPYTWLAEYTPRENWLGGFIRDGQPVHTFDTLKKILAPHFDLSRRQDLPFVIREHARKYQLGLADATCWIKR